MKMKKLALIILGMVAACVTSCTSYQLPAFSGQRWHVDTYSGNAVSNSGLEMAFGSQWMVTDTILLQTPEQMGVYPKLPGFLAWGMAEFPEIKVDSVLFYNLSRGLLFVKYHQAKPLKPQAKISLVKDLTGVYSKEYARIFGDHDTYIEARGWEEGPKESVYSNVRCNPHDKRLVLLYRLPGDDHTAIFQICQTHPKRGKWWEGYPPGTFWSQDVCSQDNIEGLVNFLHSARTLAVDNLKIRFPSDNR